MSALSWFPTLVVNPYVSVGPIRFGMTAKEVEQAAGKPLVVTTNRFGETDYRYFALSIRLSALEVRVVEVGICYPKQVQIDGIDILRSANALRELRKLDGMPFKCAGFVILPKLGFAVRAFHAASPVERVLTIFANGRWDYIRYRFILGYRPTAVPKRLRRVLRQRSK